MSASSHPRGCRRHGSGWTSDAPHQLVGDRIHGREHAALDGWLLLGERCVTDTLGHRLLHPDLRVAEDLVAQDAVLNRGQVVLVADVETHAGVLAGGAS